MSERANIAAKRLGKKSASTLHDPKAAAAQAFVHLDDDLHKVGGEGRRARRAALAAQEAAEGGRQSEAGGGARYPPLRQRQVAAGEGPPGMGDDVSNEEPW